MTASIRIGVCAESQSCMSCGEVWKYHAILPVSTFTAMSDAGEEVVAFTAAGRVRGNRIAGAEDVKLRLRIVGAGQPRMGAAVSRGIEARPRVEPRIARLHRHRVEPPLQLAGLGIVGLQISGLVEIVARSDDHVIADDDRRGRREVLLVEIGDFLVPPLLARLASSDTR